MLHSYRLLHSYRMLHSCLIVTDCLTVTDYSYRLQRLSVKMNGFNSKVVCKNLSVTIWEILFNIAIPIIHHKYRGGLATTRGGSYKGLGMPRGGMIHNRKIVMISPLHWNCQFCVCEKPEYMCDWCHAHGTGCLGY